MAKTIELRITIKAERILEMSLRRGKAVIAAVDFSFDKYVDTLLIESIDKFLKENRIEPMRIDTVRVVGAIDKNSSLYKILQAFVRGFSAVRVSLKNS